MPKSRLLTPLDDQNRKPDEAAEFPPLRPPFLARHSSTPSGISLGRRIQRHLDAGKPLYIGFDPADPPRDSTLDIGGHYNDGGERGGTAQCMKRINRQTKWMRVLTLGAPLDIAVKFILTVGMTMALLALLWAMNWLIQQRRLDIDFNLVMVVGQCIWGVFFGASCIFGMELMWGKWRRSPSAALFFTVCWVLVSLVLLVTSAVWIYFYFFFRSNRVEKCLEKTIKVTVTWDKDSLRRMAPQALIDNCLARVGSKVNWTLAWGIAYALFSYQGMIVVIWGRDYRRRLLEVRECEEAKKLPNNGGSDKVGLLLGTAPPGRLSSGRVIGPRTSSLERSHVGEGNMNSSRRDTAPPQTTRTVEQRNNTESIIRISRTVIPYGNQRNSAPPLRRDRMGSLASSISSTGSTGLGISVDGQSFMDTTH